MTVANGPGPIDAARALALVAHADPDNLNADGINQIFEEIGRDGRAGQTMLALCAALYGIAPHVGTPHGQQVLQQVIARQLLNEGEQE